jgi:hypothetical protein
MCVILVSEKDRASAEDVRNANRANSDGIGVSWVEDGKVHWRKGISVEAALWYASSLPQPYAMHFRLATVGGKTLKLTHPFPLEMNVPLALGGATERGVLLHNGHWNDWDAVMPAKVLRNNGAWSDSRAIAWLVQRVAVPSRLLTIAGGRVAIMTPKGVERIGHWSSYGDGLWASNLIFRPQVITPGNYHGYHHNRHNRKHVKPYDFENWDDDKIEQIIASYNKKSESVLELVPTQPILPPGPEIIGTGVDPETGQIVEVYDSDIISLKDILD